ncbi:hypothetical protein D2M30_4139 [Bacillus amyloliquefaciens]|nr:hypothetical protein D2M30_4139 [Bacillus amyloliquefaciens]
MGGIHASRGFKYLPVMYRAEYKAREWPVELCIPALFLRSRLL